MILVICLALWDVWVWFVTIVATASFVLMVNEIWRWRHWYYQERRMRVQLPVARVRRMAAARGGRLPDCHHIDNDCQN